MEIYNQVIRGNHVQVQRLRDQKQARISSRRAVQQSVCNNDSSEGESEGGSEEESEGENEDSDTEMAG